MRKEYEFKLFSINFKLSIIKLTIFLIIYLFGIVLGSLLNLSTQNQLYSPFLPLYFGNNNAINIFHTILYYYMFPVLGLFFATSFFGFIFIPILILLKGIFTSICIIFLLENNYIFAVFNFYGVLLTLEIFVLLIFFIQCFNISSNTIKNQVDINFELCIKQTMLQIIFVTLLSVVKIICYNIYLLP
ncbi:MAG: hypothetical protein R3Y35_07730 [Clostridia bacterium]